MAQIFVHSFMEGTKMVVMGQKEINTITVKQLKEKIVPTFGLNHPDEIRLFLREQELLDDDQSLSDCGFDRCSVFKMQLPSERLQVVTAKMDWVKVFVFISLTGKINMVTVCETMEELQRITVGHLWMMISQELQIPPEAFYLVFKGKQPRCEQCLSDCGIQDWSLITMILKLRGGGSEEFLQREQEQQGGGRGDRDGHHRSMDRLANFRDGSGAAGGSCSVL